MAENATLQERLEDMRKQRQAMAQNGDNTPPHTVPPVPAAPQADENEALLRERETRMIAQRAQAEQQHRERLEAQRRSDAAMQAAPQASFQPPKQNAPQPAPQTPPQPAPQAPPARSELPRGPVRENRQERRPERQERQERPARVDALPPEAPIERHKRFAMPQVAFQPVREEVIFIEDDSGHISRNELVRTFHWIKGICALLGLSNSIGTTIWLTLAAQALFFEVRDVYGLIIGLFIGLLLTAIQIWTSDATSYGKQVAYLTSLAIDATITWACWITWVVAVLTAVAAKFPGMILWIGAAELALLSGAGIYKLVKSRLGVVTEGVFRVILVVTPIVSLLLVQLTTLAVREMDTRIYYVAFGIAAVIAIISAWLPEHAAFGNRLKRRVIRRIPQHEYNQ